MPLYRAVWTGAVHHPDLTTFNHHRMKASQIAFRAHALIAIPRDVPDKHAKGIKLELLGRGHGCGPKINGVCLALRIVGFTEREEGGDTMALGQLNHFVG